MNNTSKLSAIVRPHGFRRRGSAFFRICGDGVLQVLKFQRHRMGTELGIGLFSMYSQLSPQWLTPQGLFAHYPISNLIGKRWGVTPIDGGSNKSFFETDISILQEHGIPWLNAMHTQQQLVDGMIYLETNWGGSVRLVDSLKIAPYLVLRDWNSAEIIVQSILQQHRHAYHVNRSLFSTIEAYEVYLERKKKDDEEFEYILPLIQERNEEKIEMYLQNNYIVNKGRLL